MFREVPTRCEQITDQDKHSYTGHYLDASESLLSCNKEEGCSLCLFTSA